MCKKFWRSSPIILQILLTISEIIVVADSPDPNECVHSLSVTDLSNLRDGRHSQGARHGREGQADGHKCHG